MNSPLPTPRHAPRSARARWMLTIVTLVVVFSLVGISATGALLYFGARAGGQQWVRRSVEDSVIRMNRAMAETLERTAQRVIARPELKSAIAALRDPDNVTARDSFEREVARIWSMREPAEHFVLARGVDVLAGDGPCAHGFVGPVPQPGVGAVLECGGLPYLAVRADVAREDQLSLVLLRELDQAYVDAISDIVLTEIVIQTSSGHIISSVKDEQGGILVVRVPDTRGEVSQVVQVDLPRPYAGVHASTTVQSEWPERGASSFPMLVFTRPLSGAAATGPDGLRISAMIPLSVLTDGPKLAVIVLALISAFMLALLAFVANRLIRRYTLPLRDLERAAQSIATGDLAARVTPAGDHEVLSLGNSFNHMVERLLASQTQLVQAEKLAALGSLSAGLAHEINTPAQFIGDNIDFQRRGVLVLLRLVDDLRRLVGSGDNADRAQRLCDEAELSHYQAELIPSLDDAEVGVSRVAEIVTAMRAFSPRSNEEREPTDVEELLSTAVTVSTSAWKCVADVSVAVDERVSSLNLLTKKSEMSQALTNIVINAAQAIELRQQRTAETAARPARAAFSKKGNIKIEAKGAAGGVSIVIRDDGVGIDDGARSRIFDPFFTTRPIGAGAGQGLTLAYAVVVERHGGRIEVDSMPGMGSAFTVWLPAAALAA